jgi:HAD superfamily hydrolase (TIGR01509 family)
MDRIYGLIFDVDGVIADTEGVNARASIAMFEELFGLQGVLRGDFEKGLGRGAAAYVRAAAKVHGFEMTDKQVEQATEVRQAKFLEILAREPLDAFDGVIELMQGAMSRGDFRVAIATSSTRAKSEAVLRSARIPYERMTYITGGDVARKKPDPELFLVAAARAWVEACDCVVLEDAPDGVAAAKAAGCRCVAVTNSTTAEKLSGADLIVNSLAEVSIEDIRGLIEG